MNKPVFALLLCLPLLAALPQELMGTRFLSLSVVTLGALVGSLLYSWQHTAVLSAFATAVAVPAALINDTFAPAVDAARLLSTLPILVFAVANAAVRTAREQRLRDVLAVSRVAQSTILRPVPPQMNGVPLGACYRSAAAEAQVGGDLYDVVSCAGRTRMIVGDVRGKGLGSVQIAARTVAAFREAAEDERRSLLDVVEVVQRSVDRELAEEDFVTAVFADLDPATGTLSLANCGHPPPLLLAAAGHVLELAAAVPSPPLGLLAHPVVDVHRLAAQDRVLLFSDGLVEARGGDGTFFPLAQHLPVLAAPDLSEGLDALMTRFDAFTRNPTDDLVLLAFAVPAGAGQPTRPDSDGSAATLTLQRTGQPVRAARQFVTSLLTSAGLAALCDDAALLTDELVSNVLLHTTGPATLVVLTGPGRVRVEVHDTSPLTPVAGVLDIGAASGRGLTMVRLLARSCGVMAAAEPALGKAVWFELDEQAAVSDLDPDALLAMWSDATDEDPEPVGRDDEALRQVVLAGVDGATYVATRSHLEDVVREMALISADPDAAADWQLRELAREITGLATSDLALFRAQLRSAAVAAVDARPGPIDVHLTLPVSLVEPLRRYQQALDAADALAVVGALLTVTTDEQVAFRRWKLQHIIDQLSSTPQASASEAPGSVA